MPNYKPFDKIEIIRKCTGFTSTQKLLLLLIASHLGKNNFCFLSLSTLQKESGLARTAISDNLRLLQHADVIWKIAPSDNYKSNRYGINFERLVVLDYQCSSLGLLDQSPRATRVVVQDYPKRNINKSKKIKEEHFINNDQKENSLKNKNELEVSKKARENIRRTLGLKKPPTC